MGVVNPLLPCCKHSAVASLHKRLMGRNADYKSTAIKSGLKVIM